MPGINYNWELFALVAVAEITGGNTPLFALNRGFSPTITRNGAGDYTLTIETEGLTAADCQVLCTVSGATPAVVAVERASATTIRVRTVTDAGVATDFGYSIFVLRPTNVVGS